MFRLEAFGGLRLTSVGSERPQPRRRLALLARLTLSGDRGVSRDELLASFWPERDADTGRHSLDQLLYEMRRALGVSLVTGTGVLRLDPRVVGSDVADFSSALRSEEFAAAVGLYRGAFMQGFYLSGSPEFERWVESARTQLAAEHRRALETLATNAAAAGRHGDAVAWWRQLVAVDPLSSRATLGLMRALADTGDRAQALECAHTHERIVRAELETNPDSAVAAFAEKLRTRDASPPFSPARPSAAPLAVAAPSTGPATIAEPAGPPALGPRQQRRFGAPLYVALALVFSVAVYGAVTREGRREPRKEKPTPYIRQQTPNIAAYELYVRGRDPTLQRSDSGVRAAIDYLSRAIALDSAYAPAYAALAYRCATSASGADRLSVAERRGMYARAALAARTAVALDDSLADAHRHLGYVKMVGYDIPGAITELQQAIAIDPGAHEAREDLAKAYEWAERPADALAQIQRAVHANPLSATANAELAHALYFARRYDEALAALSKIAALRPPLRRMPVYAGELYATTGRWKDAIAVLRPVAARQHRARGLLGHVLARSGGRTEAAGILREMLASAADSGYAFGVASIYAGLGDFDRAFFWLDRSFDDYSLWPGVMGPLFDELRADPRFNSVRRQLGIETTPSSFPPRVTLLP